MGRSNNFQLKIHKRFLIICVFNLGARFSVELYMKWPSTRPQPHSTHEPPTRKPSSPMPHDLSLNPVPPLFHASPPLLQHDSEGSRYGFVARVPSWSRLKQRHANTIFTWTRGAVVTRTCLALNTRLITAKVLSTGARFRLMRRFRSLSRMPSGWPRVALFIVAS